MNIVNLRAGESQYITPIPASTMKPHINKQLIIENLCYTELVFRRINKKLKTNFPQEQVKALILKTLKETDIHFFLRNGKNYYVRSIDETMRITINANNYRVITVDKLT